MKILGIYALGLFTINNLIGIGFSALGNIFAKIPYFGDSIQFISPILTIFLGLYFFYKLYRLGKGDHHDATPISLHVKKKIFAIFLLGLLTGLPPCPFELTVYIQAMSASSGHIIYGFLHVFWFSIGTILGLFILAGLSRSLKKLKILREHGRTILEKVIAISVVIFGVVSLIMAIMNVSFFPLYTATPP
ncbi:MAG: urease accessory protein UreH domain-containing protein [Promethearchaeota archaeon]